MMNPNNPLFHLSTKEQRKEIATLNKQGEIEDEEILLDCIQHMNVSDAERENDILAQLKFGDDVDYFSSPKSGRKGRKKQKSSDPAIATPQRTQQFIEVYTSGTFTSDSASSDEFDDDDEIDLDLEALSYKKHCRLKRRNQSRGNGNGNNNNNKFGKQKGGKQQMTPRKPIVGPQFKKGGLLTGEVSDDDEEEALHGKPILEKKVSFQLYNDVIVLSSSSEDIEKQVVPNIDESDSCSDDDDDINDDEEFADESDCVLGGESDGYDTDLEREKMDIDGGESDDDNNNSPAAEYLSDDSEIDSDDVSTDEDRIVSCYANGSEPSGDEGCFFSNAYSYPFRQREVIQVQSDDEIIAISSEEEAVESDPEEVRKGSFLDWVKKVHGTAIVIPPHRAKATVPPELVIDVDSLEATSKPDPRLLPPKPMLSSVIVDCLSKHCTATLNKEIGHLCDRGLTFPSYNHQQLSSIATLFDNLMMFSYTSELPLWPMSKLSTHQVEYLAKQYNVYSCTSRIKERNTIVIIVHHGVKKPSIRKKERFIQSALVEATMASLQSSSESTPTTTTTPTKKTEDPGYFLDDAPRIHANNDFGTPSKLRGFIGTKKTKLILYNRKGKILSRGNHQQKNAHHNAKNKSTNRYGNSPQQKELRPANHRGQVSPGGVDRRPVGGFGAQSPGGRGKQQGLKHGDVVDEGVKPIGSSNIGNIMLKRMGWSGGGLGSTGQGIDAPIQAVVRKDRLGLGL
eukprot:gene12004-14030_t